MLEVELVVVSFELLLWVYFLCELLLCLFSVCEKLCGFDVVGMVYVLLLCFNVVFVVMFVEDFVC